MDCGLAGTVLRFVPPLAALADVPVTFDGDEQARARPIAPLLDALRGLGVPIDGTGLPFRVHGSGSVAGGTVAIDASASSQFVSGLLLSGASFTEGLTVQHTGSTLPSAPHIAMTVAMLRQAGVDVDDSVANRWQVRPGAVAARHWDVDRISRTRSPFLAAAVVTGGTVRITGWPATSVQPADDILDVLGKLNAVVTQTDSVLEVRGPAGYDGFDVDLRAVGELTPSVAALAALANPGSVSRLTRHRPPARPRDRPPGGAEHRDQPPGRRLPGNARRPGITATPLRPGTWRAYADHRMAMAGAIIGLRVAGVDGRRHRRHHQYAAGVPAAVGRDAGGSGGLRPGDYDESDVKVRSGRDSRPAPRPSQHADAESAMVVSVDRGRWGCVLGGRPRSPRHGHAGARAGPHPDRRRRQRRHRR